MGQSDVDVQHAIADVFSQCYSGTSKAAEEAYRDATLDLRASNDAGTSDEREAGSAGGSDAAYSSGKQGSIGSGDE